MTLKEIKERTHAFNEDSNWWSIRAWIIATDKSREVNYLLLEDRIEARRN